MPKVFLTRYNLILFYYFSQSSIKTIEKKIAKLLFYQHVIKKTLKDLYKLKNTLCLITTHRF